MPVDRRSFLGAAAVGAMSASGSLARAAGAASAPLSEVQRLDATALAAQIRRGRISPLEALDAAIARVEATSAMNAIAERDFDQARELAKSLSALGRAERESRARAAPLLGVPFAATLLAILFTHEMGHYVVGRLRKAPVSLPYFIPMPPFISFTGTMGAVIVQREPMEDRRTILEVGIAGPLAGLAVAIPLLLFGLSRSTIGPPAGASYVQEGNSLLYAAAKWLMFGRLLPGGGVDVQLSPVAWGAWIGLLITMLNLLPIGQLDGGHVAYALLGERAHYLAYALIGACVLLGLLVSTTWLFWAVLALVIGPRHPAPLNDISRLDAKHVALAVFGLVVFVLLFMPDPLRIVGS